MSTFPVWRSAAVATALLLAIPALAAAPPLSLGEALRRALDSHPDLQGFASERDGLAANRSLAARKPLPEAGVLLEDALGSGARSGFDTAQWTLSYTQALELGEQRAGRLGVAEARISALDAEQDQRRRDALAEVTQRFIEAAADGQRHELAAQQVVLEKAALDAARSRVASARAPAAESARALAALAQARLGREHAAHEEQSARLALAVSLGASEPDFGELQAELFTLPRVRPLDELRELLRQSPAAQARLAQSAVLEAERRAALASAGLRPTITGGVRYYHEGDDLGLMVGFSMPLGTGRRAYDEAGIVTARLRQSEAENRAAALRGEELLFDRYQELVHARTALQLLDTEVLPALDQALAETRGAWERGRYGYPELAQVLQQRLLAQRERIDTAARYHSLLAELERLTGERLIEGETP